MSGRQLMDALLERHLAGDLPQPLRQQVEAALAASAPDRARLEELRADSAALLIQQPPAAFAARVEEARGRRRSWQRWLLLLAPVAAATALVLLLGRAPVDRHGIALALYAADGSAPVGAHPVLTPGDAVRFLLQARSVGYVAVIGRGADGSVRIYHPEGEDTAARYDPGQPMLPGATHLGPASGSEEIYGFFSASPFPLAPVVEALRQGRPLEQVLPPGCLSAKVPVEKR